MAVFGIMLNGKLWSGGWTTSRCVGPRLFYKKDSAKRARAGLGTGTVVAVTFQTFPENLADNEGTPIGSGSPEIG